MMRIHILDRSTDEIVARDVIHYKNGQLQIESEDFSISVDRFDGNSQDIYEFRECFFNIFTEEFEETYRRDGNRTNFNDFEAVFSQFVLHNYKYLMNMLCNKRILLKKEIWNIMHTAFNSSVFASYYNDRIQDDNDKFKLFMD